MSENMSVWNSLFKTDPAQTKAFVRGGGFKGTAIKPIYCIQKMTDQFGPCGKGWGIGEPSFQVVNGANNEILVYCTVAVWWQSTDQTIYGVGGDKVVTHIKANEQYKRPERWESDDEAFKKAFTDAVMNAMKSLGMSADVHMGLFDDSKYVSERRREEQAEKAPETAPRQEAPAPAPAAIVIDRPVLPGLIKTPAITEANRREVWLAWYGTMKNIIDTSESVAVLAEWMQANDAPLKNLGVFKADAETFLRDRAKNRMAFLSNAPVDKAAG